jgi:hypothetical protein
MAIANYFYNATLRKYVALFGTYFNQLEVKRVDNGGVTQQSMIVPISYAPFQKILARLEQNPDFKAKSAITLPRMSFEMTGMSYDAERKISPITKIRKNVVSDDISGRKFHYAGVPYNMEFQLYIMTKYQEDAVKIMEQILPFFNPDYTRTARIITGLEPKDIPLILNGVTTEDIYEGSFEERRSILYTLSFTMKGWFFGPEKEKGIIKFIDTRYHTDVTSNTTPEEFQTIQPGMTANNEPTTDPELTVDYSLIDFDDDWDYIKQISDTEPS